MIGFTLFVFAIVIFEIYSYRFWIKKVNELRIQSQNKNPKIKCYGYLENHGHYSKYNPLIIELNNNQLNIKSRDENLAEYKINETHVIQGGFLPKRWYEIRIEANENTWIIVPFHPFLTFYFSSITLPRKNYKTGKFNINAPGYVLEARNIITDTIIKNGANLKSRSVD